MKNSAYPALAIFREITLRHRNLKATLEALDADPISKAAPAQHTERRLAVIRTWGKATENYLDTVGLPSLETARASARKEALTARRAIHCGRRPGTVENVNDFSMTPGEKALGSRMSALLLEVERSALAQEALLLRGSLAQAGPTASTFLLTEMLLGAESGKHFDYRRFAVARQAFAGNPVAETLVAKIETTLLRRSVGDFDLLDARHEDTRVIESFASQLKHLGEADLDNSDQLLGLPLRMAEYAVTTADKEPEPESPMAPPDSADELNL